MAKAEFRVTARQICRQQTLCNTRFLRCILANPATLISHDACRISNTQETRSPTCILHDFKNATLHFQANVSHFSNIRQMVLKPE